MMEYGYRGCPGNVGSDGSTPCEPKPIPWLVLSTLMKMPSLARNVPRTSRVAAGIENLDRSRSGEILEPVNPAERERYDVRRIALKEKLQHRRLWRAAKPAERNAAQRA